MATKIPTPNDDFDDPDDEPISLHPLSLEDALRGFMQVDPPDDDEDGPEVGDDDEQGDD